MSERRGKDLKDVLFALALLVILAYFYRVQLAYQFDNGDDYEWYAEAMQRDSLGKVFDFRFDSTTNLRTYFNPVQTLVWRFMIGNFDRAPVPYHTLCILLLLVDALVFFVVARLFLGDAMLSFLAALSFGLFHPNVRTVAWISAGISHGLLALTFLMSFYFFVKYVRSGQKPHYCLSIGFFALGLFTKDVFMFLTPIFIVYYALFKDRKKDGVRERLMAAFKAFIPFLVLACLRSYIFLSRLGESAALRDWGGVNLSIHALYRFIDYLVFLVSVNHVGDGLNLFIAYGLIAILPFLAYYLSKDRVSSLLLLWIAFSIIPFIFSNFRPIEGLGRYLFLASMPWFMLIYYLISRVHHRVHRLLFLLMAVSYTIVFNLVAV